MQGNQKALGQYMTPSALSSLVAAELGACDIAIDFAAGDGALLGAVGKHSCRQTRLIGFDIDMQMVLAAKSLLKDSEILHGDGLRVKLPITDITLGNRRLGIVGNPPFVGGIPDHMGWVKKAFPCLPGRHGVDRAEIQFLARSLLAGKQFGARVVLVMPIGFADGDIYRHVRTSLMSNYRLLKCIEADGCAFQDTEARTVVLVIDTSTSEGCSTEICEFDHRTNKTICISKGNFQPGSGSTLVTTKWPFTLDYGTSQFA